MGTNSKMSLVQPFSKCIDEVYKKLVSNGYNVKYIKINNLKFLLVNDIVTVADNIEADPGQIYNVSFT